MSQHTQALKAVTLEGIGRTARFKGSAAKNLCAGAAHMDGSGHQLKFAFNRARPCHGDEVFPADLKIEDGNHHALEP